MNKFNDKILSKTFELVIFSFCMYINSNIVTFLWGKFKNHWQLIACQNKILMQRTFPENWLKVTIFLINPIKTPHKISFLNVAISDFILI